MAKKKTKKSHPSKGKAIRAVGRSSKPKAFLSASVDANMLRRLTAAANRLGISRSQLVDEVLADFLESADVQVRMIGNPRVMRAFTEAMSQPGVLAAMSRALGQDLDDQQRQAVLEFMRQTSKE